MADVDESDDVFQIEIRIFDNYTFLMSELVSEIQDTPLCRVGLLTLLAI